MKVSVTSPGCEQVNFVLSSFADAIEPEVAVQEYDTGFELGVAPPFKAIVLPTPAWKGATVK